MDEIIDQFLEETFDIKNIKEYHFKTLYGLTFAFESNTTIINDNVTSARVNPKGIIFEENGEYYFAPLDRTYEIDEIIKEYVKREII